MKEPGWPDGPMARVAQWPSGPVARRAQWPDVPNGSLFAMARCFRIVQNAQVSTPESLYVPDGDSWLPTRASRGPWNPRSLHGGAVASLLARELENLAAPVPMRLARLTVELLRPVPAEPLQLSAEILRDGAKIGVLEATLTRAGDGVVVARARALRIRTAEVVFGDPVIEQVPDLPDSDTELEDRSPREGRIEAFHNTGVRHRFARGMFGEIGPAFDWICLALPVVPGEEPTGWQRAAAAADFGNGVSSLVDFDGSTLFINADLTIHLWREPVGEWVGMDSVTYASGTGIGASDSAMWDRSGRIGRTNQSLLLDRVATP